MLWLNCTTKGVCKCCGWKQCIKNPVESISYSSVFSGWIRIRGSRERRSRNTHILFGSRLWLGRRLAGRAIDWLFLCSLLLNKIFYVAELCESKQRKNMSLTISWVLKGCEEIIACTNGGNVIKIIRSVSDVVKIRGQAAANGQQQPVANNRSGH